VQLHSDWLILLGLVEARMGISLCNSRSMFEAPTACKIPLCFLGCSLNVGKRTRFGRARGPAPPWMPRSAPPLATKIRASVIFTYKKRDFKPFSAV
jgi:hypothetical protein